MTDVVRMGVVGAGTIALRGILPHAVGPQRHIDEQYVYEDIMQIVNWVRGDGPSMVTAEHTRHVIEIIECAYRSAETGKVQDLVTAF